MSSTKIHSKCIKDARAKLLEESKGENVHDTDFGNNLMAVLAMISWLQKQNTENKTKNKHLGLHQTRKILLSQGNEE